MPTCTIEHASGNVIDFPVVRDLPTLLWIVNLGCIDLHPWYARCDDTDRPDLLNFDLDPVEGNPPVPFERVLEAALVVREALEGLGMRPLVKTSGSRGVHLYVPIVRGPRQKEVWTVAKALARDLAARRPDLLTAEYRIADRPAGRVLVDYNQNAWGRTLASVYSVRPRPGAPVSTPVSWEEVERGVRPRDFTVDTVPDVGSLLLGLYGDDGLLHHVGFTSSFSDGDRREILSRVEPLEASPGDGAGFTGRAPGAPRQIGGPRVVVVRGRAPGSAAGARASLPPP